MNLTRRGFLGAALAAAAAPATAAGKPKLKKAVKYGMIRTNGTVREKFELAKKLGFLGVEIDSPSNVDKDEAVRARDATGVVIHGVIDSVHWRDTLSHPKDEVRARG